MGMFFSRRARTTRNKKSHHKTNSRRAALQPSRAIRFAGSFEPLESRSMMAYGDLDPTFGYEGRTFTSVGFESESRSGAVAAGSQSDGKTVVLHTVTTGSQDRMFGLARFTTDGRIDLSFNHSGRTVIDLPGSVSENFKGDDPAALAIQSDDKILVVGTRTTDEGATSTLFIVRINADGTLDTTFGNNGYVYGDTFGGNPATVEKGYDVAIQSDGRILVVGSTRTPNGSNFAIARYMPNGSIDATFGVNGKVVTDTGPLKNDEAHSIAIQADGKIVVGGSTLVTGSSYYSNFTIVRYSADGSLDTSFSEDGILITDNLIGEDFEPYSVAITATGKIIAGGGGSIGSRSIIRLAQFESDGTVDASFGINGSYDYLHPGMRLTVLLDMTLQVDDKILVTGFSLLDSDYDGYVYTTNIRVNSNGTTDAAWNVPFPLPTDSIGSLGRAILPQPNGKVLSVSTVSGNIELSRFNVDTSPDTSFNDDGYVITSLGAFSRNIVTSAQQVSDGKTIVAGAARDGAVSIAFFAKYKSDGSIDESFSNNGIRFVNPKEMRDSTIYDFAFAPNGRIYAIGNFSVSETNTDTFLTRVTLTGSQDITFGIQSYIYITSIPGTNQTGEVKGRDVAVLANGKILIAGYSGSYVFLARLNADGTTDKTFGTNGYSIQLVDGLQTSLDLIVQPDDKILLVGGVGSYMAMRYTASGQLDTTFSEDGKVPMQFHGTVSWAYNGIWLSDGKIVVVGRVNDSFDRNQMAVARLNADGSFDTTFDNDGSMMITAVTGNSSIASSVAIQPNGNLLISGTVGRNESDIVVVSVKPDGQLDTALGNGGIVIIPGFVNNSSIAVNSDELVAASLVQSDGKIVIAGSSAFIDANSTFVDGFGQAIPTGAFLVRLQGAPTPNQNPISQSGQLGVTEDIFKSGFLIAQDPDNDPLTYEILSEPTKGTLVLVDATTGEYRYTPNLNVSSTDQFMFRVTDGRGGVSNESTISITIAPVNDPPTADNQSINVEVGLEYFGTLTGNDIDSTSLRYEIGTSPTKGTVTILNAATGEFVYLASSGSSGSDSFTFRIIDDQNGTSNEATVSITIIPPLEPQNHAPIASPQSIGTMAGLRFSGKLAGTDADQDPIWYAIATQPTKGTFQMLNMAAGTFTYTPSANSSGSDSFTFYAYDDQNAVSNIATVSISIAATNQSVKAVLVNETLVITGTTNADNLVISPNGSNYNVTIAGINTLVNGLSTPISLNNVKRIEATLGDGNDRFWVKQRITLNSLVINSGPNDDTIILGADPNVAANNNVQAAQYGAGGYLQIFSYNVQTGAGNDKFYERYTRMASNRTLTMEDGNDTFDLYGAFSNGPGNTLLNAGTGDDIINVGYGIFGGVTNIDAGEGNDLVSAYANNFIGESTFSGNSGDDTLAFDVNRYGISASINGDSEIDFILFSRSVASSATVTLNAGDQSDELVVGRYITGSANGAFTYENGGSSIYSLVINAGAGNDRSTIAANTIENLFAEFGDGDDELTLDYNLFANMPSLVGGLGMNKLKNLFSLVVNASDFTLVV